MIRLNKLVQAPAQPVYDAWLDPEQMKHWWMPDVGSGQPDVQVDARVGGKFRNGMGSGDQPMTAVGEYLEMDPPHRLVFSWSFEQQPDFGGNSRITIEFHELDNPYAEGTRATEIVFTHEKLDSAAARSDYTGGWWNALVALGYHVRGINPHEAMKN